MPTTDRTAADPLHADELAAAIEARRELGPRVEREVVDSFLDRVDRSISDRVDARLDDRLVETPSPKYKGNFTGRIVASLLMSIPLTAGAGAIAGVHDHGSSAVAAIIAVLLAVVGLNVYYTEVEKSLEIERLRAQRRPRPYSRDD